MTTSRPTLTKTTNPWRSQIEMMAKKGAMTRLFSLRLWSHCLLCSLDGAATVAAVLMRYAKSQLLPLAFVPCTYFACTYKSKCVCCAKWQRNKNETERSSLHSVEQQKRKENKNKAHSVRLALFFSPGVLVVKHNLISSRRGVFCRVRAHMKSPRIAALIQERCV